MPREQDPSRLRTLDDVELDGRTVLVRVDYNVPLTREGGKIQVGDDSRIRASLATVNHLRAAKCRVVLMSHLGRPKEREPSLSLRPVARRLGDLMGAPVAFSDDCVGAEAQEAVRRLEPGGVLVLENLRFHTAETFNDPEFALALAQVPGKDALYVNDAFGTAHRVHASTRGVADHLQSCAGFLVQEEVERLGRLLQKPAHPFVVVVGGAKVADKIPLLEHLLPRVDQILVGGAMAFTFLRALGYEVGNSRVEEGQLETVKNLLLKAKANDVVFELPVDVVVAKDPERDGGKEVSVQGIPAGMMGLDIGPETTHRFVRLIAQSKTVLLNGPMGVFEREPFARGTRDIVEAIAKANAYRVIGGGDSVAAVMAFDFMEQMDHVSTGGGATLRFLEGKTLPALEPLIMDPDEGSA